MRLAPLAGVLTPLGVAARPTRAQFIDNLDAGCVLAGGWAPFDDVLSYGGGNSFVAAGDGSSTATWTFIGLSPGAYRVSATWTAHANRATNAPFTILDGATSLGTVLVNQEPPPVGFSDAGVPWQDLGGPYTIAGDTLVVRLTNAANEFVVADAIRIEPL